MMMALSSKMTPFAFEGQSVRVLEREGDPWFVGKDVCAALGLNNPTNALRSLDGDEKGVTNVNPPENLPKNGGVQEAVVVSEPGLYKLIMKSRKPQAKRFQRWVVHELLPTVRKTGRSVITYSKANWNEWLASGGREFIRATNERLHAKDASHSNVYALKGN